jgi:hypothetical protein
MSNYKRFLVISPFKGKSYVFKLLNSKFITGMWGKARRFILCEFFPNYVEMNLSRRYGECKQCGRCCKIVFTCPMLKGNLCRIYYRGRSKVCRKFPIEPRDLKDVDGKCGYYFRL